MKLPNTYDEMMQLGKDLNLDLSKLRRPPWRLIMTLTDTRSDRVVVRKSLGLAPRLEYDLTNMVRAFKNDEGIYDVFADMSGDHMLYEVGDRDIPFRLGGNSVEFKNSHHLTRCLEDTTTLTISRDTPAADEHSVSLVNITEFMEAVDQKLKENTKAQNQLAEMNSKLTQLQQKWDDSRP